MSIDTTVLIPAWNAEAYIARALRSIDARVKVIVVDDFSTDRTTEIVAQEKLDELRIIQPKAKKSLGLVRQTALEAVDTPYAIWLDADDEYLPGRIERMITPLRSGDVDFVSDAQELCSGESGAFIKDLPIPDFIRSDSDKVRLFERNWLPGIAHVAFRTAFGKQIGYDPELHGGDDSDFVWRSIVAGARFQFIQEKGYRMYAYPNSDSRDIVKQRSMVSRALAKHPYKDIETLYRTQRFSDRVTHWGLSSMAMFRDDYEAALRFLDVACPFDMDPDEVLEPEGPYPVAEGWRFGFARGVLHLLMQEPYEAVDQFESALQWRRSADILNNLGLAFFHSGKKQKAHACFAEAQTLFPGYKDALLNQKSEAPNHITTHPLRMQPSRNSY